jgi:NAD(P)-dependent dehydrogenase (short-subunit alcohol dehydrogenase family)
MAMWKLSERYPRKRAFITGAASGLGEALCLALARDGWTLGMADMRPEPLAAAVEKVRAAGGNPLPFPLDVTDRPAYAATVEAFLEQAGGVDLLVNNAGVAGGGDLGEFSLEDWDWLMGINFMGVVNGCHFFTPALKAQRAGHVINIASAAAIVPVPGMTAYCSAKAAVKMLSEVLHNEWRPFGIEVSVVKPQFFRTALHERTRGPELENARKLITRARHSAMDVAETVLRDAGRRRLHILFPLHTHFLWWVGRLAPRTYMAMIRLGAEQMRRGRVPGQKPSE